MPNQLPKIYDPASVEQRVYENWLEKKYFHPDADSDAPSFSLVIPPPNITGQLHMGHAFDNTMQDILVRYKRMQGYAALWIPGTDHASIATEAKIVAAMAEEGLSKEQIGREAFLERAWAWKKTYGGRIVNQLKKLGSSCDWEREAFTMDEHCSKAVNEVFVRLYEKGLIYKGERIINWCPHCKTSISDAEVEYAEEQGHFWHLRYPVAGEAGRFVELATTRPETLLGDTAVAVNPADERYTDLIGKKVILPLVGREIPVIADEYVDIDFGTGVVKITPAHDPNDFEVGLRHKLPVIDVMNEDATMNDQAGVYAGMERYEARKAIVADLEAQGYLVKTQAHVHNVGHCYRCSSVVEPRVSKQWFVKMAPLAGPALQAVKEGKVRFVPERFAKTYNHWMENIRDWCISRQLWWGHRIPAWYCEDCGEIIVAKSAPSLCPKCGGAHLHQDEDTLDTWFSSALWPFSTMGWPEKTKDFEKFYPTDVLVTGYDIIFFWVARMIFSGLEHTGKVPFHTVLIHGLVRDEQGRKMSKSLGNGIDPLEIIDQYGADALRMNLAMGNSAGNDMRFYLSKVEAYRNFANKLWNAARFVLMNLSVDAYRLPDAERMCSEDKWIISRVNRLAKEVTENFEHYDLGVGVAKVYDFIWNEYCDWYIELVKPRLYQEENPADRQTAEYTLVWVLNQALKLLHPVMPFVTAEIWQYLPHEDAPDICVAKWPEFDETLVFAADERRMEIIMDAIRAIRTRRAEMNVPPSRKARVFIESKDAAAFAGADNFFIKPCGAQSIELVEAYDASDAVTIVTDAARIYIPMGELVDIAAEIARLNKELDKAGAELARVNGKLANEGFLKKAPANLVEQEKEKKVRFESMIENIKQSLAALQK